MEMCIRLEISKIKTGNIGSVCFSHISRPEIQS